jgi:hypothetical protein
MFGNQALSQAQYHPLMVSQMMRQQFGREVFNINPLTGFAQPSIFPYGYPKTVNTNGGMFGYPVNLELEILKLRMAALSQNHIQPTMLSVGDPRSQSYPNLMSFTGKTASSELPLEKNSSNSTTAPLKADISPKIEINHLTNEDSDPSAGSLEAMTEDQSVNSVEKVSSSKKIKKQNTCGHEDKPHYARGLCNNCYHKHGRTKKPWLCSHEKLYAHGLCQKCYKKASRKNLLTDSLKSQIKKLQVISVFEAKVEESQ